MTMMESGVEVPLSPATEGTPCTSQGILGKLVRKLSLKRKSSRGSLRRKNSNSNANASPLDDFNLDGFLSEVGKNITRLDSHTFFNVEPLIYNLLDFVLMIDK
nr:hypothetical protein BaRGS_003442 [Batillaria attramentaria]